MLEKDFWGDIRKNITGPHWQRIETAMTGGGIPDVNGCMAGHEVWIELKIVVGTQIRLTPKQIIWLRQRWTHGGRSFVLARHPKTKLMFLGAGLYIAEIAKGGVASPYIIPIENWGHLKSQLFFVGRDVLETV